MTTNLILDRCSKKFDDHTFVVRVAPKGRQVCLQVLGREVILSFEQKLYFANYIETFINQDNLFVDYNLKTIQSTTYLSSFVPLLNAVLDGFCSEFLVLRIVLPLSESLNVLQSKVTLAPPDNFSSRVFTVFFRRYLLA